MTFMCTKYKYNDIFVNRSLTTRSALRIRSVEPSICIPSQHIPICTLINITANIEMFGSFSSYQYSVLAFLCLICTLTMQ